MSVPFRSQPKKLAPEALFDYAVRALGRRALTEAELRRKLEARAALPEYVTEALERVQALGYLDDARTAESHAYTRKEFNSLGRRRVLAELRRRGVDPETAAQTVEEAYQDVDELELIRQHLKRKLGRRLEEKIQDPKAVQRLYGALARAGFSSGKIGEALRKVAAEPDWVDAISEAAAVDDHADPPEDPS